MPPRHAYWTIIIDDQPTAFRAKDAEEILAIFNRLRDKHPSAVMKWFERGKLWDSREAARREAEAARRGPSGSERRDRDWRPGGEHRDPRQRYKDAKKQKWRRFKQQLRSRWEDRNRMPPKAGPRWDRGGPGKAGGPAKAGPYTPPHGDPMRPKVARPAWRRDDRREGWKPPSKGFGGPRGTGKPFGAKPQGAKPFGGKAGGQRFGSRPFRNRPPRPRKPRGGEEE